MIEPRELAEQVEEGSPPPGEGERFAGYGVMGLTFSSGHVLAMRRFPVSSVGPGYTSVWHRDAEGRWSLYQDVDADRACPRYFGEGADVSSTTTVAVDWTGPRSVHVDVGDGLVDWSFDLGSTPMTRMMNGVGALMPDRWWRSPRVLGLMSRVAGPALRVARVRLTGVAPNGQRFLANPLTMWRISASRSLVGGVDLGEPAPLPEQAHLGDFWIPQRGMFVVGRAYFEAFDPERHVAVANP